MAAVIAGCAAVLALAGSAAGAAGDLDPTFGTDGVVETPALGFGSGAHDLLVLPSGDFVAAGFMVTGFTQEPFTINIDFALVRYDTNGVPDPAFGTAGAAQAEFAGGNDQALGVARQSDGKLVAAGWVGTDESSSDFEFGVARFNADGTLDGSFSEDGKATANFTPVGDFAFDVAVDGAGRILVVGSAGVTSFQGEFGDFALVRFNPDGSPDLSFGPGGKRVVDFGGPRSDEAFAVVVQPDGKAVVVGSAYGSWRDFALIRVNEDGSLDSSFGNGGRVTTAFDNGNAEAYGVVLAADGKIVVAGRRLGFLTGQDFTLARYLPNGTLDETFGVDGTTTLDFFGGHDEGHDLAIDPLEGKIIVGGFAQPDSGLRFGLARFNTNGSVDTGFGSGGKVIAPIGTAANAPSGSVALQSDGKIVIAGETQSVRFGLARYLSTGVPDTTPPQITAPDTVIADAIQPTGATVFFDVVAEDDVDGELPTTCVPESGSHFPIGDTDVVCEATDAAGNSASVSFVVHVKGAPEQIADLAGNLSAAVGGALPPPVRVALVLAAEKSSSRQPLLACTHLSLISSWIRAAARLGTISVAQGETFIQDVDRIRGVIGC